MTDPYNNAGPDEQSERIEACKKHLVARIEEQFHCMVGPPRAYFELSDELNCEHVFRVFYITIAYGIEGPPTPKNLADLVDIAWRENFLPALEHFRRKGAEDRHERLLFWRKLPMVSFDEKRGATTLRMRLCIPGFKIASAEGSLLRVVGQAA